MIDIEKDSYIDQYYDILTNNNFMPLITLPTRITTSSKTLIDNIFHNEFSNEIISGNLTIGISDHMPQFALLSLQTIQQTNTQSKTKTIRRYKQIDVDKFNEKLNTNNWNAEEFDANEFGKKFLHVFNQILDIHAPEI